MYVNGKENNFIDTFARFYLDSNIVSICTSKDKEKLNLSEHKLTPGCFKNIVKIFIWV